MKKQTSTIRSPKVAPSVLLAVSLAFISCLVTFSTQAAVVYGVTNTSVTGCSGAPHGLWTNSDFGGGSCSNNFSIDGTFTLHNDDADSANWYGILEATAANPQNISAAINLTFSGFQDASANYKQENGAPYNAATMDFFTAVLGEIDISGTTYAIDSFVGSYTFQYGEGANAKDKNEFGASAWIQSSDMSSHHWDLNLTLSEVPLPAGVWLFGSALIGLGVVKRRND